MQSYHRRRAATDNHAPTSVATSTAPTDETAILAAPFFEPPWLVDPRCWRSAPLCPFDVASTDAGTVVTPCTALVFVMGNVTVDEGFDSASAAGEKNTSAKPGAGTCIAHVFAEASQGTVWTDSSPLKRPSAVCGGRRSVRIAHVSK